MSVAASARLVAGSRRRVIHVASVATAIGAMLVAAPAAQQPFRSSVDVIAVDVQVVDREGNPIDALRPDSFEVSIKGQKRKVLSAEFIRHAWVDAGKGVAAAAKGVVADVRPTSRGGRTMILAIDIGSFDPGAERAPMEAAKDFVNHLEPADFLGLYVFPDGAWIPPTVDRASLRIALDRLVGQHQPLRSHYNLKPSEIVEITAQWTNPNSFLTAARRAGAISDPNVAEQFDPVLHVQARECPGEQDCPIRIYAEGMGLAAQLERQAEMSLGGLEQLLRNLGQVDGRKSVVLVSGGVLVSDRPEGRPDVGDLARIMGQEAARANTVVYTIHVESNPIGGTASTRRFSANSDMGRDRAIYGNWLNQFSGAAGGERLYVPTGTGNFAFERVLRESSGYYLLGVEPASEDRDGQARELKVKVNAKGVTVRSRQWVVVPPKTKVVTAPGSTALRTQ